MRGAIVLVLVGAALAGCSSDPPRACPRLGIVADASELTRYRDGGGRDITDQVFTARITDVSGNCRFDKAGANVESKVQIVVERGAALADPGAQITYFAAVVGPDDQILAREAFPSRVDFGGRTRTGFVEELTQRIPLPASADPATYGVLFGFELSPEELAENRRKRGTAR